MMGVPAFAPHLQAEVVDAESVLLRSESEAVLLRGRLYALVIPLIDGRRTTDDVVDALQGKLSMAEVYYALMQLEQRGYILEASPLLPQAEAAFWSGLGVQPASAAQKLESAAVEVAAFGDVDAAPMEAALAGVGVPVRPDAEVLVVLTDDYLCPSLGDINRTALQTGRPWLLLRPVGRVLWLGPLFVPGRTGCWACLAERLPRAVPAGHLATTVGAAARLAATEIARFIATGSSPLEGTIRTLDLQSWQMETHQVVRRPQCPVCGSPVEAAPQPVVLEACPKRAGDRSVPPDEVIARFGHHVSPLTGVVGALVRSADRDDPVLHTYVAGPNLAVSPTGVHQVRQHLRSRSGGKGVTDAHARASALCEALERHSGKFQGHEPRTLATYLELGETAIHPGEVLGFSQAQYAGREAWNAKGRQFHYIPEPFDPGRQIDWSLLWSLTHRRFKYLPTQYLYYGYPSERGAHFAKADSNGNAAGATLEEAILQGLMELIERDSVAIWWYNRIRRPGVDLASFGDPYIDELVRRYRDLGREVWVLDLTADLGVPVFAAISRRRDAVPEGILVGFGAHLDVRVAVTRALTELNQFLPTVTALVDGKGDESDSDLMQWWRTATLENQPYLAPMAGPLRRAGDFPHVYHADVRDDILHVQRILEGQGLELLVLDQTRPDIGLPVVKVVVPGLRHFWARFGPGRLYDVPVKLGWLSSPTPESDLNPIPLFV